MLRLVEIRKQVAHRIRELFPQATDWQELIDSHVGEQTVDVLIRFRFGDEAKTLICDVRPVGQPRHLREVVTHLRDLRGRVPEAYAVAAAPYISPQSAALVRQNGCGYVDLSGNCYLAFGNVLIEKEGKPNTRPASRVLKTPFAPRAARVVRALLAERNRTWRLDELARAVQVSLGHAHNVMKRLEDLEWVMRGSEGRFHVEKPGERFPVEPRPLARRENARLLFAHLIWPGTRLPLLICAGV